MSLLTGVIMSNEVEVEGADKKYVNDKLSLKLTKSGDGMSGELDMNDNKIIDLKSPSNNTDASTKKYVDDQAALKLDLSGGQMTGPLGLGGGRLWDLGTPTLDTNGANKKYVDDQVATKLARTGGTLLGELSMDDNKITDLATPTDNSDASTKKYVDDAISSVPSGSNYMIFEFRSVGNNTWRQSSNLNGFMFWTNDKPIKLTILSHVFDDDNALSNLNLYYKVIYWTKAKVKKQNTTIWKTNVNEYVSITGTWMQCFGIFKSTTFTDISCFTLEYKYFHTGDIHNESSVHCLIEYV